MKPLDQQIIESVQEGIGKAIEQRLNSYDNPLAKLINQVVESRVPQMRALIEEAIDGALNGDFGKELKDACTHKLARVLVSKMEGEIEKRAVELRQSPEFRAKVTIAIDDVIKSIQTKPQPQ